jgi:hypothetical protein
MNFGAHCSLEVGICYLSIFIMIELLEQALEGLVFNCKTPVVQVVLKLLSFNTSALIFT